jgi:hypothetical protein
MSGYTISKIFNVLSRTNGPITGASTNKLLSANLTKDGAGAAYTPAFNNGTLGTAQDKVRSGVNITAYTSNAYVKWVPYGTTAGALTVSSSDFDFVVIAGGTLELSINRSVDVVIWSADTWSATEFGG